MDTAAPAPAHDKNHAAPAHDKNRVAPRGTVLPGELPNEEFWPAYAVVDEVEFRAGDIVPHGAHPTSVATRNYRQARGLHVVVDPLAQASAPECPSIRMPSAGYWYPPTQPAKKTATPEEVAARTAALQKAMPLLPEPYIKALVQLSKPHQLLLGHRHATGDEAPLLRAAVESMLAWFVSCVLFVQLYWLDRVQDYKLLTRDSIRRAAACAVLGLPPTATLTTADVERFERIRMEGTKPFAEQLAAYDRPSLLQFFEKELGTLYMFGIPVMSTRVSRFEPGWRQANKYLQLVDSRMRLRLCVLGSSTELLLCEPVFAECTSEILVIGKEHMRTAMLAFEVASTQDTAENPVKMFRTESTDFIVHHKWNVPRIEQRLWNGQTYGPTQKAVVRMLMAEHNEDQSTVCALLKEHCTTGLMEYQAGEQLVNEFAFSAQNRGILHALFARFVALEDLHSWLVDTVVRPARGGVLVSVLRRCTNPLPRLLIYATDTWFAPTRLYTVMMLGTLCSAIRYPADGRPCLDTRVLDRVVQRLYELTVKALTGIAERVHARLVDAKVSPHTPPLAFLTPAPVAVPRAEPRAHVRSHWAHPQAAVCAQRRLPQRVEPALQLVLLDEHPGLLRAADKRRRGV